MRKGWRVAAVLAFLLSIRVTAWGPTVPTNAPEIASIPDGKIQAPLTLGLAIQLVGLVLPGIVLIPTIVFRAAGESEAVVLWAVFASVMICGLASMLQSLRVGRLGTGYIHPMGTAGAAIAVSIAALKAGGPSLLATLVFILALCQFAFSARLSLFRRILTPTVTGTVIMLTPVTVMPHIFEQLTNVPEGTSALAAPLCASTTLLVVTCIGLKGRATLRLWAPVIGIVAGSAVSGAFGLYDVDRITRASWIGVPGAEWPGFVLDFGPAFWALLPAFLFIALICTIQTISGSVANQHVSWAEPRAVDFRDGPGRGRCGRGGPFADRSGGYDADRAASQRRGDDRESPESVPATSELRSVGCSSHWLVFRKRSPWCSPYRVRS